MSLALQSLLPYPNSCEGASPHQQGRDTKMLSFCGIDVSKDRLDVMVLPDQYSSSVPNDPAGWAILVEQLRGFSITAIGIEASGRYPLGPPPPVPPARLPRPPLKPFNPRPFPP